MYKVKETFESEYAAKFFDTDKIVKLLNDYYEYSVKKKILEDLFLNSDADVINKLQYVELKLSESYYDAYSYIQSAKVNQWSKMRRKYEQAFYKKWYASFE